MYGSLWSKLAVKRRLNVVKNHSVVFRLTLQMIAIEMSIIIIKKWHVWSASKLSEIRKFILEEMVIEVLTNVTYSICKHKTYILIKNLWFQLLLVLQKHLNFANKYLFLRLTVLVSVNIHWKPLEQILNMIWSSLCIIELLYRIRCIFLRMTLSSNVEASYQRHLLAHWENNTTFSTEGSTGVWLWVH